MHVQAPWYNKALIILSVFHISIIAASNYLVQLPINIFGMHTTWGAFSFPFIFLATDLSVRLFGREHARQVIFRVMLPALILSYLLSTLFAQGQYQGLEALHSLNIFVVRIALASFMAYALGQLLDIYVFAKLRQHPTWWVAPSVSTLVGNLVDTLVFFSLAFYASSDVFMAAHWPEIAAWDYGFKLLISLLFFVPLYGVLLSWLQKRLQS
ncbi:7-cyano-7-deazaguanine/7-aminomethyl-7-deazaguanine transporter [Allopseudospirillum japonicum]|nr:7-cyano-7-deazaguanine/7-aminomethyl-7-deazaguanine transporter [Allopseudospirillum japonicum]